MKERSEFDRMYTILGGLIFEVNCCNMFFQREDYPLDLISESKRCCDFIEMMREVYREDHITITFNRFKDLLSRKLDIPLKSIDDSDEASIYYELWQTAELQYHKEIKQDEYTQMWKSELKWMVEHFARRRAMELSQKQYHMLKRPCFGQKCDNPCDCKYHCDQCRKLKAKPFTFVVDWFDQEMEKLKSIRQESRGNVTLEYDATLEDRMTRYQKEFDERLSGDFDTLGIPWSIKALNEMTDGQNKGRVTAICARTAGGKTAFAIQENAFAWLNTDVNILYFNLEMPAKEFEARLDSTLTRLEFNKILSAKWDDQAELDNFMKCRREIESLRHVKVNKFVIKDVPRLNMTQMESMIRKYYNIWGENFIVVLDNVNIVEMASNVPRHEACSQYMAKFHELVKELNLQHGIIMAQLNRDSENSNKSGVITAKDVRDSDKLLDHVDYAFALLSLGKDIKKLVTMKARTALGTTIKLKNNLQFMRMDEYTQAGNNYDSEADKFTMEDEFDLNF